MHANAITATAGHSPQGLNYTDRRSALALTEFQSGVIGIKTADGDLVSLDYSRSLEAFSETRERSLRTEDASIHKFDQRQRVEEQSQFRISVQGDLSAEELEDLESLFSTLKDVLQQFFDGDVAGAAATWHASADGLKQLDSLATVGLDLESSRSAVYVEREKRGTIAAPSSPPPPAVEAAPRDEPEATVDLSAVTRQPEPVAAPITTPVLAATEDDPSEDDQDDDAISANDLVEVDEELEQPGLDAIASDPASAQPQGKALGAQLFEQIVAAGADQPMYAVASMSLLYTTFEQLQVEYNDSPQAESIVSLRDELMDRMQERRAMHQRTGYEALAHADLGFARR